MNLIPYLTLTAIVLATMIVLALVIGSYPGDDDDY